MHRTGQLTWRFAVVGGVAALAGGILVAGIGGGSLLSSSAQKEAPKPTREQAVRDAHRALTTNVAAIRTVKGNKGDDFKPRGVAIDPNGARHVHFDRTHKGLEVLGADSIVHSKPDGTFDDATVSLKSPIIVSTKPSIDAKRATSVAVQQFRGKQQKSAATLVVDAVRSKPSLAWKVAIDGIAPDQSPSHLQVIVDATTAKVRRQYNLFHTADDATGKGLQVGEVKISTRKTADGKFELTDPDRGNGETRDAKNRFDTNGSAAFIDPDNIWGNGQLTDRATVGVDAHYGIQATWDYFKSTHGRAGIKGDGKGSKSYVHFGVDYANAGYDEVENIMIYGDGEPGSKPFTAIDVAGHEMSHGVTAATAKLIYEGESGGLNEATSDIFGTLVEFYANNPVDAPDYLIGEKIDIFGNGKPLRYMDEPKKDNYSKSCWYAGIGQAAVHSSSGVGNKFFYNLAVGSAKSQWGESPPCNNAPAVTGIGNDKAGKIWYRALTTYMVSTTDYPAGRIATLKAAKDLYGAHSTEYDAVNAAWKAVAVVGDDPFPPEGQAPTVTSPGDQTATVGKAVSLQLKATDPQNEALTYSAIGLPTGLSIDAASGLITGAPTIAGTSTVTVTAKDPAGNPGTAAFKWTVEAAATCAKAQIVANSGFESGVQPWNENPAGVIRDATADQPAHGGTRIALLGGRGAAGTDTVSQQISIPAGCTKAKLKFHLRVDTQETATTAKDRFRLSVGDKQLGFWSNKDASAGYKLRQFNLAPYAGQTVSLTFKATENATAKTTFVVDDITLDIAGADTGPAPDGGRTPYRAAYKVKLKSDATGANWTGTEKVTFTNSSATPLTEVYLRLWDNFHGKCPTDQPIKVSKVTGGAASDLTVDCTALKITLPRALPKGKKATVKFDLSIAVPDGADRFGRNGPYTYLGNALPVLAVRDAAGWHLDPYTNNGESFYTVAGDFAVTLDHPSTLKVPATGTPVEVAGAAGRTVTTATAKQVRDFAWAAGPFSTSNTTSASGVKINTYWTSGVTAAQAASLQTVSSKSIDAHSQRFGAYPYGEADVVIDNQFWFGGMEYPGFVLDMPSAVPAVHELAHQWWYGTVGNNEYNDPWLDESFADYATDLYFNRTGAGCGINWASPDEKLSNSMAYWDAHPHRYGLVVYGYGKCALHDLRRILGDAPMEKLLKDYAQSHKYGVSTTADFKAAAQKVASSLPTPVDLTSFWTSHRIEG